MPTVVIKKEEAGGRLDHFLVSLTGVSRSAIQRLIKQGTVTMNGAHVKSGEILNVGDQIFYSEAQPQTRATDRAVPVLDIVYEDDALLVINKPAGLLVHEAIKNEHRATVVEALLKRNPSIIEVGEDPKRAGIVHRLDKEVSGLLVIAKTQQAYASLKQQFQERTIHKEYLALVYGTLPKETDTITLKVARSKHKGRMVARTQTQEGKEALTHYEVLKRFATATYVKITIFTGRTHQIRVHFQALGHPIVGDKLYKVKRMKYREIPLARLFLHAHRLTIRLMDGEERTFTCALPQDLKSLLHTLPV